MSKRNENLKNRSLYLNRLIGFQDTELVKVITGIRRCGKSYLLGNIFYNYLLENNSEDHIIYIALDIKENEKLRDGNKFIEYVYSLIKSGLLPALKLGSYKIRKSALLNFLENNEGKDLTNPFDIKPLSVCE